LQSRLRRNPALQEKIGDPWAQVARATQAWNQILLRHDLWERGAAFNSELFGIARQLVRLVEETAKPNAERLREYRQSNLESLQQALFSEAPIYPDLEAIKLADSLGMALELAGADRELVEQVLDGQSPAQRAAQLVQDTRVADVAFRKQVAASTPHALAACDDPLIRLARLVDPSAREVRRIYEQEVDEPLRQAYEKLADARFALIGTDLYPDATFTLRLAFGEVRGYQQQGQTVLPFTTVGGAFQHAELHGSQEPFALPPRWLDRRDRLTLDTPLNFVCTADIIGGNSGSPVVNRQGEVVGLIFDGNIHSLVWDFVFSQEQGRAVAVDSRVIRQTLLEIYDAAPLADELGK
jgi:hypothetical protein